jgi:2-polyprenyl-3-methyl-5-hydroxy-6-metoxy-1,4-benzoquinol methylase
MKLSIQPENLIEFIGKWTGMAPIPLIDTHIAFIAARAIIEGVDCGIIECLSEKPKSLEQVASECSLNPYALRSLLGALTSSGYLDFKEGKYNLTSLSKKWLVKTSKHSIHDQILFLKIIWTWMGDMNKFLKTGTGPRYHDELNADDTNTYQKGMLALARISAAEVGKRTPVPGNAKQMLDIGGSHGLFSIAICRRHPGLHSTILDLPLAVEKASPLLLNENMGDRINYQPGDALTADLGEEKYDLIFMANLVHHFSNEQNQQLVKKIAKALKPGGFFVIQEFIRPETPKASDQLGAMLDLFFALTSESGTWTVGEMREWQKSSGLQTKKTINLRTLPGSSQIISKKTKGF